MNLNNDDINKILKNASKKSGVDINGLKKAADGGRLDDFINKNLSAEASSKLKSVLSDKQQTEKLLSTPQAKELIKNLLKE